MKYKRLTKEQQEALHQEFSNFLASQAIDKKEWDDIKANKPEVAEQELDVFSDLVWQGVLKSAQFLEHFSRNHIFLFHCQELQLRSIIIKSLDTDIDFLNKYGLQWLSDNIFTDKVEIVVGKKDYNSDREDAIFKLITEGAILSDGQLFNQINGIIQK